MHEWKLCGGLLEHGPRKLPFEAAFLIGYKWQIESSEVPECTAESIPRQQKVRPCLAAAPAPARAPLAPAAELDRGALPVLQLVRAHLRGREGLRVEGLRLVRLH